MREMSVAEQRYQAVLAVVSDGETVTDVAARFGVRRQTCPSGWPSARPAGSRGWPMKSHRPRSCPHQMSGAVEVALAEMRRAHPTWGPRRIAFELARK